LEQFSHVMVFWWADQFDNGEDRAKLFIHPPLSIPLMRRTVPWASSPPVRLSVLIPSR
jgi:hypothetical protein